MGKRLEERIMNYANKEQLKAIHATLYKKGLLCQKKTIVESFSNGRTDSSSQLYFEEAKELLMTFNDSLKQDQAEKEAIDKMVRKLIAKAYEMGWIKTYTKADAKGELKQVKDYSSLYQWVNKYGYLKKDLKKYTYKELPKLLSQFEFGPYKDYISKLSK